MEIGSHTDFSLSKEREDFPTGTCTHYCSTKDSSCNLHKFLQVLVQLATYVEFEIRGVSKNPWCKENTYKQLRRVCILTEST